MHDDEDVLAEEPAGLIEPVAADPPDEPICRVHPVRDRQPPQEWWKATVGMAQDSHPDEPASIQEALASPAAEFWQRAMTEELQSLHSNAKWDAWAAAKDLLRYVKGTATLGITYGEKEGVVVYGDADFAGCLDTRRSTTGVVFLVHGGAVAWASRVQPTVASSTTEPE
jgi:hypothetical protein